MALSDTLGNILDRFGSPCQIRVGSVTFSDYGDGSITWANFTDTGFVSILSEADRVTQTGLMNIGDAKGYFKFNSNIKTGSITQIRFQDIYWEVIGDPLRYQISGDLVLNEVNLRKVVS